MKNKYDLLDLGWLGLIMISIIAAIGGCTAYSPSENSPSADKPKASIEVTEDVNGGWTTFYVITDRKTGSQYLWTHQSSFIKLDRKPVSENAP
jgi:hypothetical protein